MLKCQAVKVAAETTEGWKVVANGEWRVGGRSNQSRNGGSVKGKWALRFTEPRYRCVLEKNGAGR